MAPDTTTPGSSQAHYSVTRGTHRRDPSLITCSKSDGDASKWREQGPTLDSTGATCYWKADDQICQSLAERWKKTLGKTVARLLGLTEDASDEDWKVADFPKDYKLYRHIKGQREDLYLLGSKYVTKFRTANEFSPHFHWLCTYEPTAANRAFCKCKYCSGSKTQGLVNSALGLTDKPKRFSSPILDQKSASLNKRKAEEEMAKENMRKRTTSEALSGTRPPRVSQKPVPVRKPLPVHLLNSVTSGAITGRKQTFSGPYVNKDRDRDLSELRCTFRMAELVWCKLDKPIDGASEGRPDLSIDYWPGICEERVLISLPEICKENNTSEDKRPRSKGVVSSAPSSPLSLSIHQKYQWKVRLLATSDVYFKDESQLLPYLNYPPPLNIYKLPIDPQNLKHIHDGHESDRPTIANFNTFSDAITPFALSLQITAHIKKSFTLMDRYDIALLKRLEARGQNMPLEDFQILYEDSALPWYQYLWWGAEKIWSGELIRLIVSAPDLPKGLRSISAKSHSCSFFLKITGIYRSNEEQGMVKGPIFELAPLRQRTIDEAEKNPDFQESDALPGVQQINRYMPKPPDGYFFRRLTPVGKEHHLVLQHIAGRYYSLHDQSLSNPFVESESEPPAPFSIKGRSLILAGMAEGKWLHMHCELWTPDRKECFKEAEASAERELIAFCCKTSPDEKVKTKSITVVESCIDTVHSLIEQNIKELTDLSTSPACQNPDVVMELAKQDDEPQGVPSADYKKHNPYVMMEAANRGDEPQSVPSADEKNQNSDVLMKAAKQDNASQCLPSMDNKADSAGTSVVDVKMKALSDTEDVEMSFAPVTEKVAQNNILVDELRNESDGSTLVTDSLPTRSEPFISASQATPAQSIDTLGSAQRPLEPSSNFPSVSRRIAHIDSELATSAPTSMPCVDPHLIGLGPSENLGAPSVLHVAPATSSSIRQPATSTRAQLSPETKDSSSKELIDSSSLSSFPSSLSVNAISTFQQLAEPLRLPGTADNFSSAYMPVANETAASADSNDLPHALNRFIHTASLPLDTIGTSSMDCESTNHLVGATVETKSNLPFNQFMDTGTTASTNILSSTPTLEPTVVPKSTPDTEFTQIISASKSNLPRTDVHVSTNFTMSNVDERANPTLADVNEPSTSAIPIDNTASTQKDNGSTKNPMETETDPDRMKSISESDKIESIPPIAEEANSVSNPVGLNYNHDHNTPDVSVKELTNTSQSLPLSSIDPSVSANGTNLSPGDKQVKNREEDGNHQLTSSGKTDEIDANTSIELTPS